MIKPKPINTLNRRKAIKSSLFENKFENKVIENGNYTSPITMQFTCNLNSKKLITITLQYIIFLNVYCN